MKIVETLPWKMPVLLCCSAAVLLGCGGGGDEHTPPMLTVEVGQADIFLGTAFSFIGLSDHLGYSGLQGYSVLADSPGGAAVDELCPAGGSRRFELLDRDSSHGVSVGDQITIVYSSCAQQTYTTSARFKVDVLQNSSPVSIAQAGPHITLFRIFCRVIVESYSESFAGRVLTAKGTVEMDFQAGTSEDSSIVTVDELETTMSAEDQSQTLTLRDFKKEYLVNADLNTYRLSMNGEAHVNAGPIYGYYTFDTGSAATGTPLTGFAGYFPNGGQLILRGKNDSYLRLEPQDFEGFETDYASIFFPPAVAGGNEGETHVIWSSLTSRSLFRPLRITAGAQLVRSAVSQGIDGHHMSGISAWMTRY